MPTGKQWISEQRFNRLVIGGIALGFLLVVGASVAALIAVGQNQRHTRWVSHTYLVERTISQFRVLLERSEAARRGLLLNSDPRITVTFTGAVGGLGPSLDAVREATLDNPRQQATIAAMRPILAQEIGFLRNSQRLVEAKQHDAAVDEFRRTRDIRLVRRLRNGADRLMAEEDRLLGLRNAAQAASARRFVITLGLSGVLLLAVAIATIWVILHYTQDLNRSRTALRRLNENLEGAVAERTADLRRANDEIQRFAYIVSHDLRSPLVNVMGFTAELEAAAKVLSGFIDRAEPHVAAPAVTEAKAAAREDLPEAIGFIRTSTQKMDRLINAILRLSREGRRPIAPEPLDMDALVQAIIDTLRHRIDELGASVVVRRGLPRITSDRVGIDQILSNIVENALKYLAPGRPGRIEISGRREGDRAVFTIEDNGRGIDPRDHDRIFDLFRRSGVQDQPGEGIGLAHTRALAYRLGGMIAVESVLGEGATFRINLPVTYAGEQGALS